MAYMHTPSPSRRRKLKCDTSRPECNHCARRNKRNPRSSVCEYDGAPQKRGRDRAPRQRMPISATAHPSPKPAPASTSGAASATSLLRPQDVYLGGTIPSEPSLDFTRKSWWDNLLWIYSSNRATAARRISADLRYVFNCSSSLWFAMLDPSAFWLEFQDPASRPTIQPSLVIAVLAISVLIQSSELGWGSKGRAMALTLRDTAQAALDASINAGWYNHSLTQAAWILASFESCCHPLFSPARAASALKLLDSIIAGFQLTEIDAKRRIGPPPDTTSPSTALSRGKRESPPLFRVHCSCTTVSTKGRDGFAYLVGNPTWDPRWTPETIWQEETRRLCWSSLKLGLSHLGFNSDCSQYVTGLSILRPAKFNLYFPGEVLSSSEVPSQSAGEPVWALYCRCMLLYQRCFAQIPVNQAVDRVARANFVFAAWDEVELLGSQLEQHTCSPEGGYQWMADHHLFSIRLQLAEEYRYLMPTSDVAYNAILDRPMVEEWLNGQRYSWSILANHFESNVMPPYFGWWPMRTVSICYSLWVKDNKLLLALEVAKVFLGAVRYIEWLWPPTSAKSLYPRWLNLITTACISSGIDLPETGVITYAHIDTPEEPESKIRPSGLATF
ncbi:hypothetical protein BOTBODRAFT_604154 [Botryobasidium botryosum FD-172 SS1]|uniref:Zn(2)-C6 fungal-type domain-containing protein n=1 Tax=Botryobasidium botryosum (strain FD-172 SS1) TaxID=930990 RepID=A0A067MRN8_BOTB1|nr:hypothetical protein BOTBODRAFT_604154 [Botryobasidium botryosum FD-172 SS1]